MLRIKAALPAAFSPHLIYYHHYYHFGAACLIWQSDCKPLWRFAVAAAKTEQNQKERRQQTRALTLT